MEYSLVSDLTSDWPRLLHTLITGTLAYIGIIVWLRVSGKRTLSKWNAFDFIVTIALGSILASAIILPDVSFVQTMTAIGILIAYQFILTWLSVHSGVVQKLIKARPTLLFFKGEFIQKWLAHERVSEGEILAAIRLSGGSNLADIDAVILETNGSFSVIENLDVAAASALRDVKGFRQEALSTHRQTLTH